MSGGWDTSLRNRSFVLKVLFVYMLVVAGFVALMFIFFFQRINDEAITDQVRHLDYFSHLMEDRVAGLLGPEHRQELRSYVSEKAAYMGARITVIRTDGRVLADSEENPEYMDNHAGRPEVRLALAGKGNQVTRYSATLRREMLYYAAPVAEHGRIQAVLRVSLFGDVVERLILGLKAQYLLIIAFLVILSTAAILIIYRNFKRAIGRFSMISRRVSEGNFDVRFEENESFEVRELSKSFENMIRRIKTLIDELVSDKEEIGSIISSIDEGIAVIDAEGKIVRANGGFLRLFGTEAATGRYYWEVIRANDIVEHCRAGGTGPRRILESEVGGRKVLCHINRLPLHNELVLIFYDVTELKNWESMKKDLVTNVSHELGTPLTAIRGYVETLLDEETDATKLSHLRIVERHTARLTAIVADLLMLSRLEAGRVKEPEASVDLRDVLSVVLPLFEDKISRKGLTLEYRHPAAPAIMRGDSFKLEQMLINLLDNALKYTEQGGITVDLHKEAERLRLSVKDTGIGIPEHELDRIFERFYVVDKSRSRRQGGTGLGLSIVKHIVLSHAGEMSVTSAPGAGTEFVISFPAPAEQAVEKPNAGFQQLP
jgi:two-component system phosphate regulon sensor histidine kinase PhoR